MATKTIAWGDGTADKITVTYTGNVGRTTLTVAADPNKTTKQRRRVIQLKATTGVVLASLTVDQKPRARAFKVSYKSDYK